MVPLLWVKGAGLGPEEDPLFLVFENKTRHDQKRNPSESSGSLQPLFMRGLEHQEWHRV